MNQNLANIEADHRAFIPGILHASDEEVTRRIEMLVRAYDPCISCTFPIAEGVSPPQMLSDN